MTCRFEDVEVEYIGLDKSVFRVESYKTKLQIYRCNTPATNAVWGEQAAQPIAAVMERAQIIDVRTVGEQTPELAKWECEPGEIDEGNNKCLLPAICETRGEGPLQEVTCSREPSRRPKTAACKPGQYFTGGNLCWNGIPTPLNIKKYR